MTHGTLRNKQTGLEVPIEPPAEESTGDWLYAAIPGDSYGARTWYTETWEYVPPRPSTAREVIDALPEGAVFYLHASNETSRRSYVKLYDGTLRLVGSAPDNIKLSPDWATGLPPERITIIFQP